MMSQPERSMNEVMLDDMHRSIRKHNEELEKKAQVHDMLSLEEKEALNNTLIRMTEIEKLSAKYDEYRKTLVYLEDRQKELKNNKFNISEVYVLNMTETRYTVSNLFKHAEVPSDVQEKRTKALLEIVETDIAYVKSKLEAVVKEIRDLLN